MMKKTTGLLLCLGLVLVSGFVEAQDNWMEEEELLAEDRQLDSLEDPATEARSKFALSAKIGWHWFWNSGVLRASGDSGVSSSDLMGPIGEIDVDYFFREWLVFTLTTGGYGANLSQYDQGYLTGYGLLSAKLQKPGRIVDYYVGAGFGAYLARVSNNVDTAYALKPGLHALVGLRFHLTPAWSLLIEDRVAFTLKAKGLFESLDLGGNQLFLGASYRF